jgi:hypothetical protein
MPRSVQLFGATPLRVKVLYIHEQLFLKLPHEALGRAESDVVFDHVGGSCCLM